MDVRFAKESFMRRYIRIAVVLVLVLSAFASVGKTPGAAQTMAPRAYLPLVMRADPLPLHGIQAHAWNSPTFVLSLVSDLGLSWVKQQVRWSEIEGSDNNYNWGATDNIADAAQAAGLRVMYSVVAAPDWARPGKPGDGPPDDDQDFADFMGAMAARYKGRVHAYEIWNEQNLSREWEGVPLSAADYVQLLTAAYGAIKAVDPDAIVVSGAMAPTGIISSEAIDDRLFLTQMYDAGLSSVCDAVGAHPYGFANDPEIYYEGGDPDPDRGWDTHPSFYFRNTLEDYYTTMTAYGDAGKQVWGTEFGWPTIDGMGVPVNDGYGYAADIDEQQQADYITRAYAWASDWGHAGVLFLWNLNMWPEAGAENEMAKFGIVRGDWSPRPAYTALRAMPK